MQDSSGAFGAWGPGNVDLWLTSYVTDFLTRAKENGYTVRQLPFDQALDRLQNFALNGEDFEKGGEDRAYALYVLARNGRAPIGELRYYADTRSTASRRRSPRRSSAPRSPWSATRSVPRPRSRPRSRPSAEPERVPLARDDYGSALRDGAALVTLVSETGIAKAEAPSLVNVVAKAYLSRKYTSTQEQAWMLLAAHALGDEAKDTKLAVGGAPVEGSVMRSLSAADLEKGLTVTNNGDDSHRRGRHRHRRLAHPRAADLQGLQDRAQLLHARRQARRPAERHRWHAAARPERAPRRRGQARERRGRRPRAAGRPPAGRPRDREPAPGRQRRHQDARLAEDAR